MFMYATLVNLAVCLVFSDAIVCYHWQRPCNGEYQCVIRKGPGICTEYRMGGVSTVDECINGTPATEDMSSATTSGSDTHCLEGWAEWGTSCYKPFTTKVDFDSAKDDCGNQKIGATPQAHLVKIDSFKEDKFLHDWLDGMELWRVHIGYRRFDSIWKWTDGTTGQYTPEDTWDDGNGDCGQIHKHNGKWVWHSRRCSKSIAFVCEYNL